MAKRDSNYKMVINQLAKEVRDNYGTPTEFHRISKIPIANYTIARALDNSQDCPAIPTVIMIAAYAGFNNKKISEMLTLMGDRFWSRLLATENLSMKEQSLLDATRIITDKNDKMWNSLANNLELMSDAVGVDISAQLAQIGVSK